MPTAVFYAVEGPSTHGPPRGEFGRAAIAAYVDGIDGRLMRSMKSILGSSAGRADAPTSAAAAACATSTSSPATCGT